MRHPTDFGGVNVAALTPQRNQTSVAYIEATLTLISFLADAGVDGIVLFGSTGEFPHFPFEDRIRLLQKAVKHSPVPVMAGIGHSTFDGAVELGRQACSAGASGLLLMPPYFFRYNQDDIHEFYMRFASVMGGSAQIFLYNIPLFTSEITAETAVALLRTGLFAGIKDSGGEYEYFEQLASASKETPFKILIGNDRIYSRARKAGAHGMVSGVACAVPELQVALKDAVAKDHTAKIERLNGFLNEFIDWFFKFPTPVAVKVALNERGLKTGPPASPLSDAGRKRLDQFREWFRAWLPLVLRESETCVIK